MKTYYTHVVEVMENGDAIVELPTELIEELGWKAGDNVDISLEDEKIVIKNLDKPH